MKMIKERAFEVVRAMKSTKRATIEEGEKAAWEMLQEIANAPEPNPSMWQIFGDDWSDMDCVAWAALPKMTENVKNALQSKRKEHYCYSVT